MSFRDTVKKVGRKVISNHEKYITRWARPAVAAGLSAVYGPVVGSAFTAATHPLHQYAATITQRQEGKQGLEARQFGRAQAKRTTIYSAAGVAVGTLAAGVMGGWGAAVTGLHGQSITGLGAGEGAFGLTNPFMSVAGSSSASSILTEAGLLASLGGTAAKGASPFITSYDQDPGKSGSKGESGFPWADIGSAIGGAFGSNSGSNDSGNSKPNDSRNDRNGDGIPDPPTGKDGFLVPMLIIGGLVLLSSGSNKAA